VLLFVAIWALWALFAWRRASVIPEETAWRRDSRQIRIAQALSPFQSVALLIAVVILLNLGTHGLLLGSLSADIFGMLMHPFMYPGILWALSRTGFACCAVAGITVSILVLKQRKTLRGVAAGGFWGFWMLVCLSLAAFTLFKLGPTRRACERMKTPPGMRLLLSRANIDALRGMEHTLPYAAAVDASRRVLFVSLKQTRRKPGGIVALQLPSGAPLHVLITDLPDNWNFSVNEFPERMAIDTKREQLYALVLSPGNNHLLVASYANRRLLLMSLIRLEAEPNNVYADEETGRIFVFYAGTTKYGFAVYDPQSHKKIHESNDFDFNGSAQHCVRDPETGNIFLTNIGQNKLIELDPRTMRVVRKLNQGNLLQGIAYDLRDGRLFASGPLSRTMEIKDRKTFRTQAVRKVRCGLADAAYDAQSDTVTVAGYTGALDVFTAHAPWRRTASLKIGRLLRNVEPDSQGRIYICSGCGVYEFTPGKTAE